MAISYNIRRNSVHITDDITKEKLSALADLLLIRHLGVAFKGFSRQRKLLPEHMLAQLPSKTGRVIAFVGAGPSCSVLPSVSQIKEELRRDKSIQSGLEDELLRLTRAYRLDPGAFETFLSACSRTHALERRVRNKLEKTYSVRHPAVLSYELLAHLMKHRYLDAIITLNFDELLDQSIDDELSPAEYVRIISERDCKGIISDADDPNYKPLYIKLHGTASDPDTLKFTRKAYFSVRPKIDSAVTNILGKGDCTLLVVGSSLKSYEFNLLLKGPSRLRVFNLSTDNLSKEVKREIEESRPLNSTEFKDIVKKPSSRAKGFMGSDLLLLGLAEVLRKKASLSTNGIVSFRSVDRHRLVVQTCGGIVQEKDLGKYLETRAVLETAFSGVKGRGVISVETLAKDRCAIYYDLYCQEVKKPKSWREICMLGGVSPHPEAEDTYTVDRSVKPAGQKFSLETNPLFDLDKLAEKLDKKLSEQFVHSSIESQDRESLIKEILKMLDEGTEIEIRTADDIVCKKMFHSPRILQLNTLLNAITEYMLKKVENKYLAVVAETGEWLLRDKFSELILKDMDEHGLQIYLVVAFNQKLEQLKERFGENLHTLSMPWWRHNKHMTLVRSKRIPRFGLYMTRRLRSPFVTPVFLNNRYDLKHLERIFCTYWLQAAKREEPGIELGDPLDYQEGIPGLLEYVRRCRDN